MRSAFEFREPKTQGEIVGSMQLSRPKKIPKKSKKIPGYIRAANSGAATTLVADNDVAGGPDDQHDQLSPITMQLYKASSFLL
jgi:hypothetical protein